MTVKFADITDGTSNTYLLGEKYLSPDSYLNGSAPDDNNGILVGYEFEPPSAGKYEIWNRLGMEFVRSPFDWRVDQGEWKTITPQDLTTDLMEVGFWNEVAWY